MITTDIDAHLDFLRRTPIGPDHDPWDPLTTHGWAEQPLLTSVEVTVTNQCNLRCEHCAVGETLVDRDDRSLDLDVLFQRLDEIDTLVTLSLTGGEPAASAALTREVVLPLLRYAKARGLRTQVNTNLTLPIDRYLSFVDLVDVLHISYNALDSQRFAHMAYAHAQRLPAPTFDPLRRLEENARQLAADGHYVSAETLLNAYTIPNIRKIHERVAELGCRRHEIHPLYPSDFAAAMALPALDDLAQGVQDLLDGRDPRVWLLFGTFPFFACSPDPAHRDVLRAARLAPNTTVRNDPDGRNRLNVSSLTGDVLMQDFADMGPLGNIQVDSFNEIWQRWLRSDVVRRLHCHCPAAKCLGPNLIVAQTYFEDVDWRARTAVIDPA